MESQGFNILWTVQQTKMRALSDQLLALWWQKNLNFCGTHNSPANVETEFMFWKTTSYRGVFFFVGVSLYEMWSANVRNRF